MHTSALDLMQIFHTQTLSVKLLSFSKPNIPFDLVHKKS